MEADRSDVVDGGGGRMDNSISSSSLLACKGDSGVSPDGKGRERMAELDGRGGGTGGGELLLTN